MVCSDDPLLQVCVVSGSNPTFGGSSYPQNTFTNTGVSCWGVGCPTTTTTSTTTTRAPMYYYGGVDCCGFGTTAKIAVSGSLDQPTDFPYAIYIPGKGCYSLTASLASQSVNYVVSSSTQQTNYFYGGGQCTPCITTYGCPATTTSTTTGGPNTTSTTTQYIGQSTTTTTLAPTSTSTTTVVWFGYNLFPVFGGTCDASGANITAYKFMSGGSINNGDTLYASQNLGDPLATGYYSDGGFRYEVNTGVVSNKTACPGPTSTTTSTSTSTTTLSQINGNGTYECASGYSVCNGAFNISSITGGSGAPYQTSMVLTGDSPIWNDYPAVNSYTGLCGGTNYTFSVKDSNGNIKAAPFTMCFTTSTTTSTTTVAPTCTEYRNDNTYDVTNVNYITCAGTTLTNQTLYGTDTGGGIGQSICAQDGTLGGSGAAYLTNVGSCT